MGHDKQWGLGQIESLATDAEMHSRAGRPNKKRAVSVSVEAAGNAGMQQRDMKMKFGCVFHAKFL